MPGCAIGWPAVAALAAAALALSACAGLGRPSPELTQAVALERQGHDQQAIPLRQSIADAAVAAEGEDSVAAASAFYNLANDQLYVAQTLHMFEHRDTAALFDAAKSNADRALAFDERHYDKDDTRLVGPLMQLGLVARFQNRPDDAASFFDRALAINRKAHGPTDASVADVLFQIAELDETTLRFADEEPVLKEELAIEEAQAAGKAATDPASLRLAQMLDQIENFEINRFGRYDLAERYSERSLAIREQALPPDDPRIGESLLGLAVVYQRQNRLADAEPLLKRAIAIKEKKFGADSKEVAIALNLLAGIYDGLDRGAEQRATLLRMLAIDRKVFGEADLDTASALALIGDLDRREGHLADATTRLTQARAVADKGDQRGNLTAAGIDLNLAKLALAQRRYGDAEAATRRALATYLPITRATYPDLIVAHDILAKALQGEGRLGDAFAESNAALAGLRERALVEQVGRSSGGLSERRGERDLFLDHIAIVAAVADKTPSRRPALDADAYEAAQLAQASSTAEAVAGMAARFAAGDDALAAVIRERQDAEARWRQLDGDLVQAASLPPDRRDAAQEAAMRTELHGLDATLATIDQRIAADFPKYAEIADPAPVPLAATQKLLRPGEAMLVYMVGADETYVWAMTAIRAQMFRAAIGRDELAKAVVALRRGLDPSDLDIVTPSDIPPFDVTAAWQLYQKIFAPAVAVVGDAKVVYEVPDAALQSLPLGVLVTAKPLAPITDFAGYRAVPWLARRYATTVLPSVSSLRMLRIFTARSRAPHPFLGIGDPSLGKASGATRGVKPTRLLRGGEADVDTLRSLPALPETAGELRAIAAELGASPQDLVLADQARKPAVMKLDFAQYRVVAFATHGLVAGDITGLAEPALVLTPPPGEASPADDGLLTASQVSQLHFDADWVVLSACNTAAGDGSPDAEGLSGLAKAFFYAGSRTLLVSHWPVISDATVKLTTGTFAALAQTPNLPRAVALQRAMLALQADDAEPYFADPMFWAPFIVVGEGGAN
ncbi:MAG TPA: CHAT domain-containing tetratricopeptide repeat protein [Stellaceae bacterium]|nr:CHAT domain-containing tetratricopeptide repeat protein [Stellaceae bacterium]